MILPVSSKEVGHGSLSSLQVPVCHQTHPPCPEGQAVLPAAVLLPSLPRDNDYFPAFFFSFLFKRADVKAGSPSFLVSPLLWVESILIGVGNSNNKKQAHNSSVIYLPQPSRHLPGFQERAKGFDSGWHHLHFPLPTTAAYHYEMQSKYIHTFITQAKIPVIFFMCK